MMLADVDQRVAEVSQVLGTMEASARRMLADGEDPAAVAAALTTAAHTARALAVGMDPRHLDDLLAVAVLRLAQRPTAGGLPVVEHAHIGSRVFRRTVVVVADWEEVAGAGT